MKQYTLIVIRLLVIFCVLLKFAVIVSCADTEQSNPDSINARIFQDLVVDNDNVGKNIDSGADGRVRTEEHGLNSPAMDKGGKSIKSNLNLEQTENLQNFLAFTREGISWVKSYFRDEYEKIPNPSTCVNDTLRLVDSALSEKKWTIPFLDSAGKPGPSVTWGWVNFVGNLEQCEDAVAPSVVLDHSQNKQRRGFKGSYVVLTFFIGSDIGVLQPKIGLCLPDSCDDSEIYSHASEIIRRNSLDRNITVLSAERILNKTETTTATVIAIILLVVVGCMAIAGTIFDILYVQPWGLLNKTRDSTGFKYNSMEGEAIDYQTKSKNYDSIVTNTGAMNHKNVSENEWKLNKCIKILLAFSVYTNAKKLLSTSQTSESIGAIHGIRYISISWVLLGHIYYVGYHFATNTVTEMTRNYDRWTFVVISNAFPSVDTFFAISGLLTAYVTIKSMTKNSWKINWPMFYFHRIWRLTPPYMAVLILTLGMTQYLGQGAIWSNVQPHDRKFCEDYWWKNVLYINNFHEFDKLCMSHTWYLANDMQFYLISPLLMIPFYFHPLAGLVCNCVALLTTWTITGVISSVNDWSHVMFKEIMESDGRNEWLDHYYLMPWSRIGPYIIGIICGFFLTKVKGISIPLKWWLVTLGWGLSITTALLVLYGVHGDISGDYTSSADISALYNSVSRTAWGASICWIILACDMGYGGPVNVFLSWSPFVVLGRLTYVMYLIHPFIFWVFFENLGMPYYMKSTTIAVMYVGLLVINSFLAFVFVLLFESPMIALEKVILRDKKDK